MSRNRLTAICIALFALCIASIPAAAVDDRQARLDGLFTELKAAPDEPSAREVEGRILTLWTRPEDAELAALMQEALQARRWRDTEKALSILDRVVEGWPTYAEGWNQRATVHFSRGDYEKSLEDVAKVLEYEPRHFGAIAGRGVIRLRQGKHALAMQNIIEAMKIHPFLKERVLFPGLGESR